MKILKSYKLFEYVNNINKELLEFKSKDIQLVKDYSKNFNIAFEIELESNDIYKYTNPFKFNTIEELRNNIKDLYFELYNKDIEKTDEISENKTEYENVLNILFKSRHNIIEAIFDFDLNELPIETKISLLLRPLITSKYFKYNKNNNIIGVSDFLIEEFEKNFPTFYNKYKNIIELKNDNTLVPGGIEIIINKKKIYLDSLDDAIEYLNIFYYDYSNINNRFFFSNRTGIHINISVDNKTKKDYNVIKGLLFLSDTTFDDFIPIVFKDNVDRMNSHWCRSVIKELIDYIKYKKEPYDTTPGKVRKFNGIDKTTNIISELKTALSHPYDIEKIEQTFNKLLFEFVYHYGKKQLGFNIYNLKENDYVEFRYNGQNISKNTLISKLLYYCYIVYIMTNKNFKEKEFKQELVKFSDEIKQIL